MRRIHPQRRAVAESRDRDAHLERLAAALADGQAQVVEGFKKPSDWIQHDLWVQTEFDSDGDGKVDRVHVEDGSIRNSYRTKVAA